MFEYAIHTEMSVARVSATKGSARVDESTAMCVRINTIGSEILYEHIINIE